jgi:NADH-quinone oxidoreductase subunit J
MELAIFLLFAGLALASAIVVVSHRNPVHSTMSLVVTLFSVAVLFVMLGAPFIGTLQILIYAGAILVLFLFVIMLLNVGREEAGPSGHSLQKLSAFVGALVLAFLLVYLGWRAGLPELAPLSPQQVSLTALAQQLFGHYLLPFEMIGLLLLVAVVGATVVARRPQAEQVSAELGVGELNPTSSRLPRPGEGAEVP